MTEGIFSRVERLLGDEGVKSLSRLRVIIFGVGGVGSWCAEALVRTGICHLTIVDADCVSITNINRQLMATTETIGQSKVEVLRQRLLTINPEAEIIPVQRLFTKETASDFHLDEFDCIVDAIDSLKDKAALILEACRTEALFVSSMGAALKIDPTRIRVAEFRKIEGDPLARAIRKKFKALGEYPSRRFLCVYSDELLQNLGADTESETDEPQLYRKAQVNGSLAHITAIFGCMLAGLIVEDSQTRKTIPLKR